MNKQLQYFFFLVCYTKRHENNKLINFTFHTICISSDYMGTLKFKIVEHYINKFRAFKSLFLIYKNSGS